MTGTQKKRIERDKFWAQAENATGATKARLLGQGVTAVNVPLHKGSRFAPILEKMKKADPTDESKWQFRLTYNPSIAFNNALNLARGRKFDEAVRLADQELQHSFLSTNQRIHLLAAKYNTYRMWPNHVAESKKS